MIQKPTEQIDFADLNALVSDAIPESKTLEYKREMPTVTREEKIKLLAAISSLANTSGGDLLIGINASDGIPVDCPGIDCGSIDAEKLKIENLSRDCIDPRIPRAEIRPIISADGRCVLLVRVHRSWLAPHRVTLNDKFYGRNSAGKYPLDVAELRSAFVLADAAADRIRNFRTDRIIKITAGETAYPVADRPLMVIQAVPMSGFAGLRSMDAVDAVRSGHVMPMPPGRHPGDVPVPMMNLDGLATVARPDGGTTHAYAQLFRSGAIEGVATAGVDPHGTFYIFSQSFENNIVSAVKNYLILLQDIDAGLPIFVSLSFCKMENCHFRVPAQYGGQGYYDRGPLRLDTIALPEVMIDSYPTDVPAALRTNFNTIWNGYGYEQSDKYNEKGEWIGVA